MTAAKKSAASKNAPAKNAASSSGRTSSSSVASTQAKTSRQRVAEQMGVSDQPSTATLVEKSSGHIKHREHGAAGARTSHRKGHGVDQQVKSLAHIYTPWANVRANGSGVVAIAAWSKRLADEGKSDAKRTASSVEDYTRGLTHR